MRTGPPLPPGHTVYAPGPGALSITRLVLRLDPHQVFVDVPVGRSAAGVDADINAVIWGHRCRQSDALGLFWGSGLLISLACRPN